MFLSFGAISAWSHGVKESFHMEITCARASYRSLQVAESQSSAIDATRVRAGWMVILSEPYLQRGYWE